MNQIRPGRIDTMLDYAPYPTWHRLTGARLWMASSSGSARRLPRPPRAEGKERRLNFDIPWLT